MKKVIIPAVFIFLTAFTSLINCYNCTITTAEGADIQLSDYQNKKILLVVLPATKNAGDSALLIAMDSIVTKDSVVVIGIPSYEDGFQDDSLQSLTAWYRSLAGDSVIICQGMNTRKASPYQSDLFAWITNKELNGHFDEDVMGAGSKYFINEAGDLYGIVSPDMPLTEDLVR